MRRLIFILFVCFSFLSYGQDDTFAANSFARVPPVPYDGAVYVENGGIAFGADASVDVPFPGTVSANDIFIISVLDADNDAFDTPTDWALIYQDAANANATVAFFWLRAAGTESGTVTVTGSLTAGQGVWGVMSRYTGCVTTGTPYEDATGVAVSQTSTPTIPEITSTDVNRLAVGLVSVEDNITLTGMSAYTQAFQELSTGGSDANLAGFTQEITTASTVVAEALSLASAEYTGIVGILLKPD